MIKNLHIAKVIDNNDPDKKGFVKIYIPYMHFEIANNLLPWAIPFQNFLGGSITAGISIIPEIDSYIWVFFEDEEIHKNPFYVGNVVNQDVNISALFEDNIKSSLGSESSYPNNKFLITDNGICIGFSTETGKPEVWVYHPKSYLFINKDGNLEYKDNDNNNIKLNSDGLYIKDTNGNIIEADGTTLKLNSNLEVLQ